ncbi:MAG: hypothetical protein RLZZ93_281 [Actinomycetota bacterium]
MGIRKVVAAAAFIITSVAVARGLEFAENEPPWVSWVDRGRRRR